MKTFLRISSALSVIGAMLYFLQDVKDTKTIIATTLILVAVAMLNYADGVDKGQSK